MLMLSLKAKRMKNDSGCMRTETSLIILLITICGQKTSIYDGKKHLP